MIKAGPSKGNTSRGATPISWRNVMKAAGLVLICGMLYAVNTGAQTQEGAQAGVAASGQASAQASQHGAQASAEGNSSANASAQGTQGSAMLADGTAFNATLDKPIDSQKSKAGEPVTAHTTEAVKSGRKTILPKGTKMMGHVTEASARANGQADSQLGIVFDKAVMKDGQEMTMNASIQALGALVMEDLPPQAAGAELWVA
jgi:type IV secretory pathway VirB10-like protein